MGFFPTTRLKNAVRLRGRVRGPPRGFANPRASRGGFRFRFRREGMVRLVGPTCQASVKRLCRVRRDAALALSARPTGHTTHEVESYRYASFASRTPKTPFSRKTLSCESHDAREGLLRQRAYLKREEIRQRLVHADSRDQTSQLHGRRHGASCDARAMRVVKQR